MSKKLTVEQARQMGRDRMPLRLDSADRTLVLRQNYEQRGSLVAQIEVGENRNVAVARMDFTAGAPPFVTPERFGRRGSTFPISPEEGPLIDVWLDGYYADGGAA